MSITVNLTPESEEFIRVKLESGRYDSAGQIIEEALRALENQEQLINEHREEIRQKIAQGIEDLKQGRSSLVDEEWLENVKRRGRARREALGLTSK